MLEIAPVTPGEGRRGRSDPGDDVVLALRGRSHDAVEIEQTALDEFAELCAARMVQQCLGGELREPAPRLGRLHEARDDLLHPVLLRVPRQDPTRPAEEHRLEQLVARVDRQQRLDEHLSLTGSRRYRADSHGLGRYGAGRGVALMMGAGRGEEPAGVGRGPLDMTEIVPDLAVEPRRELTVVGERAHRAVVPGVEAHVGFGGRDRGAELDEQCLPDTEIQLGLDHNVHERGIITVRSSRRTTPDECR